MSLLITALVAFAIQAAQSAGLSIQQWINSPTGQKFIHRCIQEAGQRGLQEIMKKLGIDF